MRKNRAFTLAELTTALTRKRWASSRGFTLVELIVVITILAILATIAFLSFGGYSANARDSVRLSDMTNLSKGLYLYQTKVGSLPLPERKIDITAGATTIGYQGYADTQVLSNINASDMKDPLDTERYTYATNKNLTKYQILGFLEGNDTLTFSPTEQAYATTPTTYANRYPISKGDTVGILTDAVTKIPAQAIPGVTSIPTSTTATGYAIYFDTKDTIASATGSTLFSAIYNRRSDLITDKTMALQDASLVGYWDMETMSGGKLYDLSGHGNDGTLNGGIVVGGVNGKRGKGMSFNGITGQNISIPNNSVFDIGTNNDFTIFILAKTPIKQTYSSGGYHYNCLLEKWSSVYPFTVRIKDQNDANGYDANSFGYPGKMASFRYDGTNNPGIYSNKIIADETFHGLVFTKNKQKLYNYIDGSKDSETLDTTTGNTISPSVITIGTCTSGGLPYSGTIDEVRIYNRALSDSEIQSLYNATK